MLGLDLSNTATKVIQVHIFFGQLVCVHEYFLEILFVDRLLVGWFVSYVPNANGAIDISRDKRSASIHHAALNDRRGRKILWKRSKKIPLIQGLPVTWVIFRLCIKKKSNSGSSSIGYRRDIITPFFPAKSNLHLEFSKAVMKSKHSPFLWFSFLLPIT